MELILGSTSARRKEILSYFSHPFTIASPTFDESQVPFMGDPGAYVTTLAIEKAHSLKPLFPKATIITCDTIVYIDGKVLGKPKDKKHMEEMLSLLSGKWHSVFTAVAVTNFHAMISDYEETRVQTNSFSKEEIRKYINGHLLHDKAGAYAIQESGGLLVRQIQGCYYNVLGLPINTLRKLLQQVGIDLLDHLQ
jgi:septum formation protein